MRSSHIQGGNMNGSDAPPASIVNKITWSRYVTLDSLIFYSVLAGSEALMLPPCTFSKLGSRVPRVRAYAVYTYSHPVAPKATKNWKNCTLISRQRLNNKF